MANTKWSTASSQASSISEDDTIVPSPRTRRKNAREWLEALKETDSDFDDLSEDDEESTTPEVSRKSAFLIDLDEYDEDDIFGLLNIASRGGAKTELIANCRAPCTIDCMLQDSSLPQSFHPADVLCATKILETIAKDEQAKRRLQSLDTFTVRINLTVDICKNHPRAVNGQWPAIRWNSERVWRASASLYSERLRPSLLFKELVQAFLSLEAGPNPMLEFYTTSVCGEETESRRAIIRDDASLEEAERVLERHFS